MNLLMLLIQFKRVSERQSRGTPELKEPLCELEEGLDLSSGGQHSWSHSVQQGKWTGSSNKEDFV